MPNHYTAVIHIGNGHKKVIGFYPSEAEAFVMANRAWERWVNKTMPKGDREVWLKAGHEFAGYGPKVEP